MEKRRWHLVAMILLLTISVNYSPGSAEELSLKEQIQIFMKVAEFNKSLLEKVNNDLRICFVFSEKNDALNDMVMEIDEIFYNMNQANFKVKGKDVKYSILLYTSKNDLESQITTLNISALFLMSAKEDALPEIASVARNQNIFTFSGNKDYFSKGVSVVVDNKAAKPEIFINLKTAKDQGADFNKALFKIAKTSF